MKRREVITLTADFLGLSGFISHRHGATGDRRVSLKNNNPTDHNLSAMKTIGILGGLGPQATMDLEMRLPRITRISRLSCMVLSFV
jgi:hypothetical protein